MPFKLSEEEQRLGIITLGCILLFFFYVFFLAPLAGQAHNTKVQLKAKKLELKVAEQKIAALRAIEKNLGNLPLKSVLPREEKALEVLRLLSQATDRSGLNLVLIKPLLDEPGEGLKFTLNCTGSYQELYDFLFILFRLPMTVVIDDLEISANGGTKPQLDAKIILIAFY